MASKKIAEKQVVDSSEDTVRYMPLADLKIEGEDWDERGVSALDDGGNIIRRPAYAVDESTEQPEEVIDEVPEFELTLEYLAEVIEDMLDKQREFNDNVRKALPHITINGGV